MCLAGGGQIAIAFNARQDPIHSEAALPLDTDGTTQAVAFQPRFARNGRGAPDEIASALTGEAGRTGRGDSAQCVAQPSGLSWRVRRLTPTECERLQGFPDGFTNIPWRGKNGSPDGPRYKVLGNSMSQNTMRWLGIRIQMVTNLCKLRS